MIVLFLAMRAINRYYTRVTIEVAADDEELHTLPSRAHALVLVSRLHKPAMQALALARGMRPDVISAVTLAVDADETRLLRQEWESRAIPVQLTMLEAPYRDPIRPLISYVKDLRRANPRTVIMVFIPRLRRHPLVAAIAAQPKRAAEIDDYQTRRQSTSISTGNLVLDGGVPAAPPTATLININNGVPELNTEHPRGHGGVIRRTGHKRGVIAGPDVSGLILGPYLVGDTGRSMDRCLDRVLPAIVLHEVDLTTLGPGQTASHRPPCGPSALLDVQLNPRLPGAVIGNGIGSKPSRGVSAASLEYPNDQISSAVLE